MSENDALLLRRCAEAGDAEAFAAIVRRYAGLVFGTCRRVLGDETEACDATQETFFQLLRNAHRVTGSLGGWLHQVAVNRSRDLLRAHVSRREREAAYSAQTLRETDKWEHVAPAVDEGLESLPAEERELLVRHFLQGQSMVELAAAEGVSQPTISRRMAEALEHLRAELRQRGVLVGVALLGAMLPQAVEAAPEMLLQSLGKIVLGQAAASSAAGAGGVAAQTAGAVAAASSAGLCAKLAACGLVVVAGVGAVIAHRTMQASQPSSAQAELAPAPPLAATSESQPASPFTSPGSPETRFEFAGDPNVTGAQPIMDSGRGTTLHPLQASPAREFAQVGSPPRVDGGYGVRTSRMGGSTATNFSFSEERQSRDGTRGSKAEGGGGAGAYASLGGRGSVPRLAVLPYVQKELGLSAQQKEAVQDIVDRVRALERRIFEEVEQAPVRSRGRLLDAKFAEAEKEVARARQDILRQLTGAQAKRLDQIGLQEAGASALLTPEVAQALGLSPQQKQQLAGIQDSLREQVAAMHGYGKTGRSTRPATVASSSSIRELLQQAERRMEEMLTVGQRARFNELKGAPFAFPPGYRPMMSISGGGGGGGSGRGPR